MYGSLVRRARVARGLSQRELAQISGLEQSNISAIETGRRIPTVETLHRLLFACGFELVATAGQKVLACPPPRTQGWSDDLGLGDEIGGPTAPVSDLPMATRVRMLTAALDAAEAIVRSR